MDSGRTPVASASSSGYFPAKVVPISLSPVAPHTVYFCCRGILAGIRRNSVTNATRKPSVFLSPSHSLLLSRALLFLYIAAAHTVTCAVFLYYSTSRTPPPPLPLRIIIIIIRSRVDRSVTGHFICALVLRTLRRRNVFARRK